MYDNLAIPSSKILAALVRCTCGRVWCGQLVEQAFNQSALCIALMRGVFAANASA